MRRRSAISVILAIGALTIYRSLRRAEEEVPSHSARGTPEPMAAG